MSLTVEAVDGIIAEDAAIDKDVGLAVVGVASGAEQACHRERGMHYAHSCRPHRSQATDPALCSQLQVTRVTGHESAIMHTTTGHTGQRARVNHYTHSYRSHKSEGTSQPLCTQLQVTQVRGHELAITHTATGHTDKQHFLRKINSINSPLSPSKTVS